MNDQEETGTVKWFDARKGYGFITRPDGDEIFVHYSSILQPASQKLEDGDQVSYMIGEGRKGPAATNVKRIEN